MNPSRTLGHASSIGTARAGQPSDGQGRRNAQEARGRGSGRLRARASRRCPRACRRPRRARPSCVVRPFLRSVARTMSASDSTPTGRRSLVDDRESPDLVGAHDALGGRRPRRRGRSTAASRDIASETGNRAGRAIAHQRRHADVAIGDHRDRASVAVEHGNRAAIAVPHQRAPRPRSSRWRERWPPAWSSGLGSSCSTSSFHKLRRERIARVGSGAQRSGRRRRRHEWDGGA